MSTSPDLPTSALFSPSKARAHQAQARDWAAVDAWLAKKYLPTSTTGRLPNFERTEDTLQALLTLATLNDSADELRANVERVQAAALAGLGKAGGDTVAAEVLPALIGEVAVGSGRGEGSVALDALADVAVALDVTSVDVLSMARAITELTAREFELRQQVERASEQVEALRGEQKRMEELLVGLQSPDFGTAGNVVEETAEWVKGTKQLKAKVAEYDERLAAGKAATESHDSWESLREKMSTVAQHKERLAVLEAEVNAYQNLPTNPRAAQAKLNEARIELQRLMTRRDQLFEGMVEQD